MRGVARRLGSCFVVCATLAVASAGCTGGGTRSSPATPHQVSYALDWSSDGVERDADGGWETVNDLGYRIHVRRGWVVSYSMELVECPKPVAMLGERLWSLVEGTAYAGHSEGTPNPAAMRSMQVESLTAPAPKEFGSVLLAPQAYCQVHYLVARAAREARELPKDLDMVDTSLHIEGTYRAPGSEEDVPFTIHTAAAYGALFDHPAGDATPLHVDTGASAARVVVRRNLARTFDGVDFAKMKPVAIEGQILRSLVEHTEIEVHEDHAPA